MWQHPEKRLQDAHVDPALLGRVTCGETAPPDALVVHHVLLVQSSRTGLGIKPGSHHLSSLGRHTETPQVVWKTNRWWRSRFRGSSSGGRMADLSPARSRSYMGMRRDSLSEGVSRASRSKSRPVSSSSSGESERNVEENSSETADSLQPEEQRLLLLAHVSSLLSWSSPARRFSPAFIRPLDRTTQHFGPDIDEGLIKDASSTLRSFRRSRSRSRVWVKKPFYVAIIVDRINREKSNRCHFVGRERWLEFGAFKVKGQDQWEVDKHHSYAHYGFMDLNKYLKMWTSAQTNSHYQEIHNSWADFLKLNAVFSIGAGTYQTLNYLNDFMCQKTRDIFCKTSYVTGSSSLLWHFRIITCRELWLNYLKTSWEPEPPGFSSLLVLSLTRTDCWAELERGSEVTQYPQKNWHLRQGYVDFS